MKIEFQFLTDSPAFQSLIPEEFPSLTPEMFSTVTFRLFILGVLARAGYAPLDLEVNIPPNCKVVVLLGEGREVIEYFLVYKYSKFEVQA